jgi:hypothetical protein
MTRGCHRQHAEPRRRVRGLDQAGVDQHRLDVVQARAARAGCLPKHPAVRPQQQETVKEVAVEGGVPDLMVHLVKAERRLPDGSVVAE